MCARVPPRACAALSARALPAMLGLGSGRPEGCVCRRCKLATRKQAKNHGW